MTYIEIFKNAPSFGGTRSGAPIVHLIINQHYTGA